MSLGTEGVPFTMPVQPANSGSSNNGSGWGGDWSAWIIIFVLFFAFGGWGNGFGGGWGGGNGAGAQGALTRSDLCSEFNFNGLESSVRGIQQGICDSTFALNNGINGLGMNMMQGFSQAELSRCNQQAALMQQLYQMGYNQQDCCCKTQNAIEGVKFTIAQEDCATRNLMQSNTRDVIENQNSNARAILDALTAQRIEAKDQRIAEQAAQIQSLQLAASQANQNAVLRAAMEANTAEILRKTGAECPMPAYVVQPPQPVTFPVNCCGQAAYNNGGCGGCGC